MHFVWTGSQRLVNPRKRTWPLHDIAITNIVWCMA